MLCCWRPYSSFARKQAPPVWSASEPASTALPLVHQAEPSSNFLNGTGRSFAAAQRGSGSGPPRIATVVATKHSLPAPPCGIYWDMLDPDEFEAMRILDELKALNRTRGVSEGRCT